MLTAVWEIKTYNITYDSNGGTDKLYSTTKDHFEAHIISDIVPTRAGYDFLGWLGSDGNTYLPGDLYETEIDITLYAIWEKSKVVSGDTNRDEFIDSKDAVLLAQYLAKWNVSPDMDAADCNNDGTVDSKDAVLLAQYLAKWNVTLG